MSDADKAVDSSSLSDSGLVAPSASLSESDATLGAVEAASLRFLFDDVLADPRVGVELRR
jgi:hypothetical protein